jgi:hypothetical protein
MLVCAAERSLANRVPWHPTPAPLRLNQFSVWAELGIPTAIVWPLRREIPFNAHLPYSNYSSLPQRWNINHISRLLM